MKIRNIIIVITVLILLIISCEKNENFDTQNTIDSIQVYTDSLVDSNVTQNYYNLVKIYGEWGHIYLWLFDETPLHKERFLWLTNNGYFDHQTFNRVVNNFVVQGGNDLDTLEMDTILEMTPYEKVNGLVHQIGALGAARLGDDENPLRMDLGDQWYICEEIDSANAARLDTGYVIFGQVISDLEVIKQLGRKPVNFNSDIPRNPIYFNIDTVTVSQTFLIDSIGYNIDTLMIPQQ